MRTGLGAVSGTNSACVPASALAASSSCFLRCCRCIARCSLSAFLCSSDLSIPRPNAPLTSRLATPASMGVRTEEDEGVRAARAVNADEEGKAVDRGGLGTVETEGEGKRGVGTGGDAVEEGVKARRSCLKPSERLSSVDVVTSESVADELRGWEEWGLGTREGGRE